MENDKMVVEQELAQELASTSVGKYFDGWLVVENQIVDHSRWSIHFRLTVQSPFDQKFYQATYTQGATEYQNNGPFEYDDDGAWFQRVEPKQVTITEYQAAQSNNVVQESPQTSEA